MANDLRNDTILPACDKEISHTRVRLGLYQSKPVDFGLQKGPVFVGRMRLYIVANRILSFIDRVGNHSHLYGEIEKYFIATDDSVIEIDTDYSSHKKRAR